MSSPAPTIHLIYGMSTPDLDYARAEVELALDLTLDPRAAIETIRGIMFL